MREPADFAAALAALGEAKRDRAARPGDRRRRAGAPGHRPRRQGDARPRPDRADEGGEERGRDRRRARRPCPRRRRGGALSRLVRARSAGRQAHRDRRRRGAGNASAATPACSRTSRSRPSPAPGPTAPSCTTASPARAIAAIAPGELFLIDSGAQYQDGTTDITRTLAVGEPTRGDARPLHPRAQGPHRDRARGVSRRHHRRAARFLRAPVPVGRPGSISTTAPATASAAICRCTRARRASPSSAPPRSSAA